MSKNEPPENRVNSPQPSNDRSHRPAGEHCWASQQWHPTRTQTAFFSLAVGVFCAVLLGLTSPSQPMGWDEGDAILRAEGITAWFDEVLSCSRENGGPWSREEIARCWRFTTAREGHPALYGWVIAAGTSLAGGWLAPLSAARLGPMLLFALAVGAMSYRVAREYSLLAALAAAAALVTLPRLFAHAHFASFDGPLVSCWLLAWAAFAPARRSLAVALVWGVLLGMTFSCKASGWLSLVPFVIWAIAYRDRAAGRALLAGVPVALATFWILNPPLWHAPWEGFATFWRLNLHRADQSGLNISTWFLGRMANLDHPLPWYNTLFWTAVTTPCGTLLLFLAGLVGAIRYCRSDRQAVLLVGHWAVLVVARAIPGTPPHDAERLILPSFAFLAILAGTGGWQLLAASRRWVRGPIVAGGLVGMLLAGSASSLIWYTSHGLSYYNLLIGGLPGAVASGMEATYYWDALDRSVLDWLRQNSGPQEKTWFAAPSVENLRRMSQWGWLEPPYDPQGPGRFRWVVIQYRRSAWSPTDAWLVEHAVPAFRHAMRRDGWGPWRIDVPLVNVYSYGDYRRARQVVRSTKEPAHEAPSGNFDGP